MRAALILFGTTIVLGVGALLLWRPALALGLAVLGAGVSIWRMKRPLRQAHQTLKAPATPVQAARPPMPATAPPVAAKPRETFAHPLAERLMAAGWMPQPAASGQPWLLGVQSQTRVALRPALAQRVTIGDIEEAMAAKAREQAQYAAVLSELRPAEDVAAAAKAAGIHIVNSARLEAYLTVAASFRPLQKSAEPHRVPA
jgi:hypothetical protein